MPSYVHTAHARARRSPSGEPGPMHLLINEVRVVLLLLRLLVLLVVLLLLFAVLLVVVVVAFRVLLLLVLLLLLLFPLRPQSLLHLLQQVFPAHACSHRRVHGLREPRVARVQGVSLQQAPDVLLSLTLLVLALVLVFALDLRLPVLASVQIRCTLSRSS